MCDRACHALLLVGMHYLSMVYADVWQMIGLQGYILRDTPNLYLTALAIMSGPNLCGQLLGPILSATGLYFAGEGKSPENKTEEETLGTHSST